MADHRGGFSDREEILTQDVDDDDSDIEKTKLLDSQDIHKEFEIAIQETGFGRFHLILLLVCGWAAISDSVEIQSISFVLPSACDLNLSSTDKGILNGVIFLGMIIGAYAWGTLGDIKGRRYVLILSLTSNGIFSLLSSISPNFSVFVVLRFLSGLGVGASLPVVFTYFCEFFSRTHRGRMITLLATSWLFGSIITSAIAWLVIPHRSIGLVIGDFVFGSWRVFIALCSIPSFTSALIFVLMPESPKFLQQKGQTRQALSVLQRMYRTNNPEKCKSCPYKITHLPGPVSHKNDEDDVSLSIEGMQSLFKKMLAATCELFVQPLTTRTLLLLLIWFTLSFGFYGLFMWFPELFQRIEAGTSTCGGQSHAVSHVRNNSLTCEEKQSNVIYSQAFLVALANLPGNLFTVVFINKIGAKKILAFSMMVAAGSVFFIMMVTTSTEVLILSCVFNAVATCGWNSLDVLCTGLYPTHLRATAFSVQSVVGRIGSISGNIIFGLLVDVHCSIPISIIAVLLASGGFSTLLLPYMDKQILH